MAGEELALTIVKDKLRFLGFNGKVSGVIYKYDHGSFEDTKQSVALCTLKCFKTGETNVRTYRDTGYVKGL